MFILYKYSGYPEFILNPDEVDKHYEGLKMQRDNYLLNNIRFQQFQLRKKFMKFKNILLYVNMTEYSRYHFYRAEKKTGQTL